MFQTLVSHNDDLRRLLEKGYAIAFDSNHLIVRDIPYLDHELKLQIGAIVTVLVPLDGNRVGQTDHQVYFAGSHPCGLDGTPIPNLGGGPTSLGLSDASSDVVVQRSFSNKPVKAGKFEDFFEKIESYVNIISGPAMEMFGDATPLTFCAVTDAEPDPIFKFQDSLTSIARISDLASAFENDVIAVIGLGGTGSYLLDFLVKTRVREIRGFDADPFYVHNSYRSPGRVEADEFAKPKAEVYESRYENFRTGLSLNRKFIDASSAADLQGVTFAFVCVDRGFSRAGIFDLLISMEIPFIDVGMGLNRKRGPLAGMLRATYYSVEQAKDVRERGLADLADPPDNIYRTNVQIGELNALNACLAIILFKQLRGFYVREDPYYHLLFDLVDFKVVGEYQ
jgi:hypothetical protein